MVEEKNSEKNYEEKLERLETAARVEEPDRVPIAMATLYLPAKYSNITYEDMFYDQDKYLEATTNFARDFDWDGICFLRKFESVPIGLALAELNPDLAISAAVSSVLAGGASHDILGDRYSKISGRELPENTEGQFVPEGSFMKEDEYDELIEDPFQFHAEKVVPRAYESLENMASPKAVESLIKFGKELERFPDFFSEFTQRMKEQACPPFYTALTIDPLDYIGAFLRDFQPLMTDLFRKPDKVKEACETLTPILTEVGKATGKIAKDTTGSRIVFCPFWYNTYLNPEKWKEFHWPYAKEIINELIDEDFIPLVNPQGDYEHLLDTFLELPEKKFIAWHDKTDLSKAKEVIGDHACHAGGIPSSLLIGGTPKKVKKHVEKNIKMLKPGGGFIFSTEFDAMGDAKIENVRAMTEAVMEYGEY